MPLFDYLCEDCGKTVELLMSALSEHPTCSVCGSSNMKKLVSAPSSMSGAVKSHLPGPGDKACCGSSPTQASCAGPGSCCGKAFQ